MKTKVLLILALAAFLISSLYAQNENPERRMINELNILNEPSTMHFDYDYSEIREAKNRPAFDNLILTAPMEIDPDLAQLLQSVLEEAIIEYEIKGLSAALSTPNGDIWKGASGISHDTVNLTTDMLFGVASNTKNLIATIIMQLYEADSLKLSDSLYKWLPPFENIDSTITIRQLLNHTSGIFNYNLHPAFIDSTFVSGSRIWTPEEILETFVLSPYFPAGTDWEYSNTNYILLGLIIEEITGNEAVTELHNRLTIPLGLNSTFLFPDEGYDGIKSHVWNPYEGDTIDVTELIDTTMFSAAWTAAALLSTAEELVKWSKGLNEGGILNDTTLDLMREPAPYSDGIYGLGTFIAPLNSESVYGHNGDIVYYSRVYYVPGDSLSISVISNQSRAPIKDIWLELYFTYMDYVASLSCLPDGMTFSTQEQIDNFQTNYPYCLEIGGDVVISGNDITNLDSLISLTTIDGYLEIHTNEALESLSGLDSLESINGDLIVYLNDVLTDFTGLENLSTIDGNLAISINPLLNSLDGLDNIEPGSIDNLTITDNENLSKCDVESICVYLANSGGTVKIQDNTSGCNSQEEVQDSCGINSVDKLNLSHKLFIYPNPSSTQITIELPSKAQVNAVLTIYNMNAQQMVASKITEQKTVVDISGLPEGVYFVKIIDDQNMTVGKLVKN